MVSALAVTASASLALTGCAASAADADAESTATRTVQDAYGTVTVPVAPKRIVALDEYAAVELLALGVTPVTVYGTLDSKVSAAVLEAAGVPVKADTAFLNAPDYEALAADRPDVLVLSDAGPLPAKRAKLGEVAPVVGLSFADGWKKALTQAGDAFGASERAAGIERALSAQLDTTKAAIPAGSTLSIVYGYSGALYIPETTTVMSTLAAEVGLGRPAAETADTTTSAEGQITFSPETLAEHQATATAVLAGGYYTADLVRQQPLFPALEQAEPRGVHDVDGDTWYANNVFAVSWILDDLTAVYSGSGNVGAVSDASARWSAFLAAVSAR